MNLENMENSPRKAAENNRCGFHRVKVVSQKFTGFGVSGRKITRNDARYLAGMLENKTSRNATASHPALTNTNTGGSHGC